MDRTSISRRIGSIKTDITKLSNTLCAIENTDMENYPDNYAMMATGCRIAQRTDRLPYAAFVIRLNSHPKRNLSCFRRGSTGDPNQGTGRCVGGDITLSAP